MGSVRQVGQSAFENNSALKSLVIPNTVEEIGSKAFAGCSIERLEFHGMTDENIADNAIEVLKKGVLLVGKETKKLTGTLLKGMDDISILFEGDNVIEISGVTDDFFIKAMAGLNGTYHVDSQGVLYSEDNKTLIYCPPDLVSCVVPESVEAIGNYAFSYAENLTEITFTSPQSITGLGERAFYNCVKLAQINGETTVAGVTNLFSNCQTWGKQLFLNTALSDAPQTGGILQTDKIEISKNAGDARLEFGFVNGETTTIGENRFENLTGDTIRLVVNADGPNTQNYQYRIYMETSDADCSFGINVDETLNLGVEGSTTPVTLRESDVTGVYYLEFALTEGSTVSFDITPLYPSPMSSGGTLTIWGAILTDEEVQITGAGLAGNDGTNAAQMTEWKTRRSKFVLDKKPDTNMKNGLILRGDGTADGDLHIAANGGDERISYYLDFKLDEGDGNQDNAYGKDYVQKIRCEDKLELPSGMHWQPKVLQAIHSGRYYAAQDTYSGSSRSVYYYVEVDGEVKQIAQIRYGTPYSDTTAYDMKVDDNRVVLCWDLINKAPNQQEIKGGSVFLSINSEFLQVAQEEADYDWGTEQILTNHAMYTVQYTHSGEAIINAETTLAIHPPQSNITLAKNVSISNYNPTYRGENVDFTITLKNEGAVAHNGLIRLEDTTLPKDFYIKPENIERMFRDAQMGRRMELTIAPVYLYETLNLGSATSTDGSTMVPVTPENSSGGVIKSKNGKLVFNWENDELKLNVYYDNQPEAEWKEQYVIDLSSNSGEIQSALDSAGYVVTYGAEYDMVWNLESMPLYGGQVLEIILYSTLKDTFQYLQHSQRHEGDFSSKREANQATVFYKEGNEEKYKRATDDGKGFLSKDFRIDKSFAVNGKEGHSDTVLYVGDLVDYTLSLTHHGIGNTNNIPMIDYMIGPQQLLVPAEANRTASWAVNLKSEIIDDVEYYILTENDGNKGEYKNVWVGVDENGVLLCADSVKLVRNYGQLQTTITWYYNNLPAAAYGKTITYKARLKITDKDSPSSDTGSVYLLNNEVWINGRPSDYLYDFVGMYITNFIFGKEIVVSADGEKPEELVKHSIIKKGSRVKYKLNLDLYSNITNSINVNDAFDILPETYGLFDWNQNNVNVSYVDGQGNSIEENYTWHIEKTDSDGQTVYTIRWDKLTIPVGNLAIYVTLDFPSETEAWDSYAAANEGNLIYNKFYIGSIEKEVSHELAYTGRAYLQKGVYRIGHYSARWFMSTNTHTHYINEDGNDPSIVYYIQIYNGGKSRLYLTEIQDQLPKGFSLQNGRAKTGYIFDTNQAVSGGHNNGRNYTYTQYAKTSGDKERLVAKLTDERGGVEYKSAKVMVEETESELFGAKKLTFTFGAGNASEERNVNYDLERNLYYLKEGEAITFAYACDTGKAEDTEDYAENSIAMPYLDYSGGGIEIAQGIQGSAQGDDLIQNVGLCRMMEQEEALQKGFFIQNSEENQKWLCSDVTVERGAIIPGITKKITTYVNESGIEIPYANGAGQNDKINWKVNLFNNGQVPMVDYKVKDVMEFPYTFTGDVKYVSYQMGNKVWMTPSANGILFTVNERTIDASTGETLISVKLPSTNGTPTIEIPLAESEKQAEWQAINAHFNENTGLGDREICEFQLRFYREGGREVMEIRFNGMAAQVLSGGYAELEFSTSNTSLDRPYKIYTNNAVISPEQLYVESFVTQGLNVTDETGKNAGVKNSAAVVISGAYATSSLKTVEEADVISEESNKTDSSQEVNYILLPNKEKEFTYTLTVNNDNQNLYSIGNLVFIDNLPEPGDHATFSEDNERGSMFKIGLAENPDVQVQIESKEGELTRLPSEYYKVDYAEKTKFEASDWRGAEEGWNASHTTASRALRVQILPTTNADLIPEGAKVHVSFKARIDGNANAGDIGWNSFGYFYSMINESAELLSAPQKVGVKIPEVPILEKRLITANNGAFLAKTDQTFRFLIHQGAVLDGLDYNDETAVKTALSGADAPSFTVVPVTVRAGDSSGQVVLAGLKQWKAQRQSDGTVEWTEDSAVDWTWTDKTQYTIAELTPKAEYQFFRLCGSTTNGVSFYHQDASPVRLDCENRYPGWSILLKKVDSKIETTLLPGAIFAFYSPNSSDQIAADDSAYLALGESERPALTYVEAGGESVLETTWYLAEIRTTGDAGTIFWEGLAEEAYRLKEVRAPEGYQMSDNGYISAVKPERQAGNTEPLVLAISVKNTSAFVLPKTGGTGTLPVNLAGILCLCYSGFLYKKKRAGKITQKEKGGNEK